MLFSPSHALVSFCLPFDYSSRQSDLWPRLVPKAETRKSVRKKRRLGNSAHPLLHAEEGTQNGSDQPKNSTWTLCGGFKWPAAGRLFVHQWPFPCFIFCQQAIFVNNFFLCHNNKLFLLYAQPNECECVLITYFQKMFFCFTFLRHH